MSVMVNMNSTSDTTGAGAIDSWHSVATTIDQLKNAHGAQAAALGVELGISVVSAVADTVALVLDPFAKLISAGLGWLIEHVSFLKAPLDQILGNPQGVTALAEALHKTAENLRNTAKDMGDSLGKTITSWKGNAYDTFKGQATALQGQIDNTGHAVDVAGYMMDTTGAVIGAVRNLVRDMITTVLGDIIATVLIGLSLAPITFGASLVASVAKAVVDAVETVAKAAKVLKAVTTFGKGAAETSHELSTVLKDLPKLPRGGAGSAASDVRPTPHPGAGSETGGAHGETTPSSSSSGGGGHDTAPKSTTPTGGGDHNTGGESSTASPGNTAPASTKPSGTPGEENAGGSGSSTGQGAGNTAPSSTKPSGTGDENTGGGPSTSTGEGSGNTAPSSTKPSDSSEGNGFHDDGGDNSPYDTWKQWNNQHGNDTPGGSTSGSGGHEGDSAGGGNAGGGQNTGHQGGEGDGTTTPNDHQNTNEGQQNTNEGQNTNDGHQNNGQNQDNAGGQNGHQNTNDGGNTGGNPATPPAKQGAKDSYLKYSEQPQMKKHEDWLKNEQKDAEGNKLPPSKDPFRQQLADFWNGTNKTGANRFGQSEEGKANGDFGMGTKGWENYLKDKNRPDWVKNAYPWLKTISDAKSSKTTWGMIDKTIVNLDKSFTPIQEHADTGWQEADKQNQGDNPDGSGGG